MATKPTVRIPLWASGGTTTDPGGGKEATGWLPDERPPANWWNWVWNAMGQWLGWSETSFDELTDPTPVPLSAMAPKAMGVVTSGPSAGVGWNYGIDDVIAQSAHLVLDITSAGLSASSTSIVMVNHTLGSTYTAPTAYFDNPTTVRIHAPRIISSDTTTNLSTQVFTFHVLIFGD
ncbi:MAG: hypothetical protein OEV36_01875 [Myxococcales bacterium]|nr:hypothetical protein [Myxococcales bacterium]